jgi:competence protein ComEA
MITTNRFGRGRARRWSAAATGAALAFVLAFSGGASWAAAARIDVNTADATALAELPGIGPAKAAAIVAERKVKPFASVEDLQRVRGLGPATVEALKERVTVKPRS